MYLGGFPGVLETPYEIFTCWFAVIIPTTIVWMHKYTEEKMGIEQSYSKVNRKLVQKGFRENKSMNITMQGKC